MSSIVQQINDDIKQAMKAKEKERLNALRAIKSALLLAKTEKGSSGEIQDAEAIKILQKMVKQRKDSATIYKEQGRDDLLQKEMQEAEYIEDYLPKQLSDEELKKQVKEMIIITGSSSMKDIGKVMGMASKKLAGKADNKRVSAIARQMLS